MITFELKIELCFEFCLLDSMSSTTTTSSDSSKRKIRRQLALNSDEKGKRRNTLMSRVNRAKTLGKKIPVQFDEKG